MLHINRVVFLTRPRKVGADRLPWCRQICLLSITGRRLGTETCGVGSVFPPNDLKFGRMMGYMIFI